MLADPCCNRAHPVMDRALERVVCGGCGAPWLTAGDVFAVLAYCAALPCREHGDVWACAACVARKALEGVGRG